LKILFSEYHISILYENKREWVDIPIRKRSSIKKRYFISKNKVKILNTLLPDDFEELVSAYYGKPMCIVANTLGIPCEVLENCCKRNRINNLTIMKPSDKNKTKNKTVKRITRSNNNNNNNINNFISDTYGEEDKYNKRKVIFRISNKSKKLSKKTMTCK